MGARLLPAGNRPQADIGLRLTKKRDNLCAGMLDSSGNHIARIGRYGYADDGQTAGTAASPGIFSAWPTDCDSAEADGWLYVSDSVNRRVVVIRFDHDAEATVSVA